MTAPQIMIQIGELGKARLSNEVSYDQKTNRLLDQLFVILQKIEPDERTGDWAFWLTAPRGTFRDFKENYVGYYAALEDDDIELDAEFIETWWQEEFAEPESWFHFAAREYKNDGYRAVFLNHRCIVEQRPWIHGEEKDASELVGWILTAVNAVLTTVRNGSYNERVAKELPPQHRIGTMTRETFWDASTWLRKEFFRNLSERDISDFMADAIEDPSRVANRIKEMTANDFFSYCVLGYRENEYRATWLSPREQYCFHANGQDDGLTTIDPDSPRAFAEWFHNHEPHGHPWEVCKGWRNEHISLFVHEDDDGYYLTVSGSGYTRCREAIKFYLVLRRAGLPVCMVHAEHLKKRLMGTERIGVVPQGILPFDCQALFPNEDLIDFTHLPKEKRWETASKCVWQELKPVHLKMTESGDSDAIIA